MPTENTFPSLLQSAEDERRRKLNEDCEHEIGFNGFCAKCGEEQPCEEVDQ